MLRASILVSTLAALASAGCAASPPPPAVASPPRLVLAEATPESSTAPASPEPHFDPESEHHARQMNRVWGWVALSVGIDASILAVVTSGMMLHQASIRSGDCSQKVCNAAGMAANGKLSDMAPWNAAAWGVALVGIPVGVFLLVTNPTDKSMHSEVGAGQTGSGSGLILRGSF